LTVSCNTVGEPDARFPPLLRDNHSALGGQLQIAHHVDRSQSGRTPVLYAIPVRVKQIPVENLTSWIHPEIRCFLNNLERAKQSPQLAFTSLPHLIDVYWLHEAFARTRKDGAVGVDGQTAQEYIGDDLQSKLIDLLNRAKSGTYRAPPVRRVHIPKGTG